MSAERRVRPSLRKEDIAGPLDLGQQVESRTDVFLGRGGTQRVMKVAHGLEHPRFTPPVFHVAKTCEERVAYGRIGRYRGGDELELRLPIRVLDSIALFVEHPLP